MVSKSMTFVSALVKYVRNVLTAFYVFMTLLSVLGYNCGRVDGRTGDLPVARLVDLIG